MRVPGQFQTNILKQKSADAAALEQRCNFYHELMQYLACQDDEAWRADGVLNYSTGSPASSIEVSSQSGDAVTPLWRRSPRGSPLPVKALFDAAGAPDLGLEVGMQAASSQSAAPEGGRV